MINEDILNKTNMEESFHEIDLAINNVKRTIERIERKNIIGEYYFSKCQENTKRCAKVW